MSRRIWRTRGAAAASLTALVALGLAFVPTAAGAATADSPAVISAANRLGVGGVRPAPASEGPSAAQEVAGGTAQKSAAEKSAQAASSTEVKIYGHGLGPGWGMGQLGSYGYASMSGYRWSYQQIVGHYYGGTHLTSDASSVESTQVPVNLSEMDNDSTTTLKANRSGAYVTVNGKKRWGTRVVIHDGQTITIKANVGDVRVDLGGYWRAYQGYIQIQPDGETWNIVPLEDYVAGVVPIESSASWGIDGEASLQTQAVAARSYALNYLYEVGYICDTQSCQVYEGDPGTNPNIGSYVKYSDEAATSTRGKVVCRDSVSACPLSDIVSTQYAASTGGYTSGAGFPAVVDAGDAVSANPWHDWTEYISTSELSGLFPSVGTLTSLLVTKRNGDGDMGGRAVTVQAKGKRGTATLNATIFADDLGLPSNWFRFSTQP